MKIRLINKWGHKTSLNTWRQSSHLVQWVKNVQWNCSGEGHASDPFDDGGLQNIYVEQAQRENHIPDLSGQDSKPVSLLQIVTDAICEQQKGTLYGGYVTQSVARRRYVTGEHTSLSELKEGQEI